MQKDALLQYGEALDRGDFDTIAAIWERICEEGNTGLTQAIMALHGRFDSHESFTQQLVDLREKR